MSLLSITDVQVLNPFSKFSDLFEFKIAFNCMEELSGDLEWNLIYVGSSESSAYDQIIDSVRVGPIPPGNHEFDFISENPVNPKRIQEGELLGPTVIILNASYNDQEFVRVGYYVNIVYEDPALNENPPPKVDFDKLCREILASEPRVTRFKINWTDKGEKYSISDQAVEQSGGQVSAGMTAEQLMAGSDENMPPSAELLMSASQNSILSNRMEALLAGLNDNSNGPGAFGSSSFKAGYGVDFYETTSTSMDGNAM